MDEDWKKFRGACQRNVDCCKQNLKSDFGQGSEEKKHGEKPNFLKKKKKNLSDHVQNVGSNTDGRGLD